jgi:hypothetical protein
VPLSGTAIESPPPATVSVPVLAAGPDRGREAEVAVARRGYGVYVINPDGSINRNLLSCTVGIGNQACTDAGSAAVGAGEAIVVGVGNGGC